MTEKHNCSLPASIKGVAAAVDYCYEDDERRLIVSNGEYGNQVFFCPFCGKEAENKEPEK